MNGALMMPLIAAALSIGFVVGTCVPQSARRPIIIQGPYEQCGECSLAAQKIAASLDLQGDAWGSNDAVLTKPGLALWVANGAQHLQVALSRSDLLGDAGWFPTGPDRDLIWRAVQRWQHRLPPKREADVRQQIEESP